MSIHTSAITASDGGYSPIDHRQIPGNPLLRAASRLLAAVARLKPHSDPEAQAVLRVRLGKYLEAFARQIAQAGIETKDAKLASYLLCTFVDEAVLQSAWGKDSEWATNSLLQRYHGDTQGGERFFQSLERCMQHPILHLDLLELMHMCLLLGFEGRYAASSSNSQSLQQVHHTLQDCIARHRSPPPQRISHVSLPEHPAPAPQKLWIPYWLPISMALLTLLMLYSGLAWTLAQQREAYLRDFIAQVTLTHIDQGAAR